MEENIIIGILAGLIANLIYDRLKGRPVQDVEQGSKAFKRRGPRWFLIIFSVIPGFVVGAILAYVSIESGMVEESKEFSLSFYVFIGIGSVLSYAMLNRIFRRL